MPPEPTPKAPVSYPGDGGGLPLRDRLEMCAREFDKLGIDPKVVVKGGGVNMEMGARKAKKLHKKYGLFAEAFVVYQKETRRI